MFVSFVRQFSVEKRTARQTVALVSGSLARTASLVDCARAVHRRIAICGFATFATVDLSITTSAFFLPDSL